MFELIALFGIPLISAFILFALNFLSAENLKRLAVIMSLIPLAILVWNQSHLLGAQLQYSWLPSLSIYFHLSIDSLSLVFLYLTAVIVPIVLVSVERTSLTSPNLFFGLVLLLQALLIGFFTARDLVVFTLFYEAMLLPLYFIIVLWGGEKRQSAALKFLTYMIGGSVLMVAGILALYLASINSNGSGTFNLDALASITANMPHAKWVGAIFLLAFAVKTPLFPFHAWLPDAYCQAPTSGTILLSALLSKAGIYGILRVGFELFPALIVEWSPWLLSLAIAGVFYGGMAAWAQKDFKRLIAYSSFSHVNFILAGLFVWDQTAHAGSILQSVNHGLTIAALFLTAGWLEDRLGSTFIRPVGGFAKFFPYLCWLTLFFVLANVALPGTNNFVGELMILFGLFGKNPWVASFLTLSVVLSVMYMLRYMQKVYFEAPGFFQEKWTDINGKEFLIALPLIALILWIGIYPKPFLIQIEPAAKTPIERKM